MKGGKRERGEGDRNKQTGTQKKDKEKTEQRVRWRDSNCERKAEGSKESKKERKDGMNE